MRIEHHLTRINSSVRLTRRLFAPARSWLSLVGFILVSTTLSCASQVTPCLQLMQSCNTVSFGSANTLSGVVANCGNVTITNVVVADSLYGILAVIPSLTPGQSFPYSRYVTNFCGYFPSTGTASGRATSGQTVSANASSACVVAETPCLQVTKSCNTVILGSPNTISGMLINCGNVTLTGIAVVDSIHGQLAMFPSLSPGGTIVYSRLVTNN